MLLDAGTLAVALNRPAVADNSIYSMAYIADVIADAAAQITAYLQYNPVLTAVVGEEGYVELDSSGVYRSLYRMQLTHAPLIPGTAAAVFSRLLITYARATLVSVPADLTYATLQHQDAQLFLSPGALSFLAGVSLDLDNPFGSLTATGYVADYVAGFSTGISDPVPIGGGSYNAPPMPGAITQAAVLLCRERLAMDDAGNADTANVGAGSIQSVKAADLAITYRAAGTAGAALGYGTSLSQAAAARLAPYRRRRLV